MTNPNIQRHQAINAAVDIIHEAQESLDFYGDRFAVQKLQNVLHYLTAPKEYADCYEIYGSLEIEDNDYTSW